MEWRYRGEFRRGDLQNGGLAPVAVIKLVAREPSADSDDGVRAPPRCTKDHRDGQGQSFIAVIEVERKAIETADISRRLEATEAHQSANDPDMRAA